MPAINVNPIRPAAWGPRDFPSSGGMNPPGIKVLPPAKRLYAP
jgi:hypothetical protein